MLPSAICVSLYVCPYMCVLICVQVVKEKKKMDPIVACNFKRALTGAYLPISVRHEQR